MLGGSGRVIMVSGASRGLGLAIAKRLHEAGFTVAAGARNPAATALCPGYIATDMTVGETEVSREDMTQPDDLAEMVETLLRLPNNLSVAELLVNCRKEAML
ncbi:MAG: hypothetical protein DI595_00650 [Agrobacterium fabrum]|uniref:Uncharacterized protein n=1 Tax=Agrobacterium fabrum TaxID=1176649 RepID=A0A2W5FKE0_9HYPH|nr:MAG: hypothetical protein DI595_00650 [Agrobacterium fabrum]